MLEAHVIIFDLALGVCHHLAYQIGDREAALERNRLRAKLLLSLLACVKTQNDA
jgi:hypothetical protein